jgi:uncharacterized FlaG/YvyC family protein
VVTSVLGNLQLPPATVHTAVGEVAGRPIDSQATIQSRPKSAVQAEEPHTTPAEKPKPVITDETQLAYSVDTKNHALVVKITNHHTGELVRTLSFKDFSADTHTMSKLAGHLVDEKT